MKASIIIPAFNSMERLYYNLLSLNNQDCNFNDFEVIIVDNGSSDNTANMVIEFAKQSKFKIKLKKLKNNKGIARGRNTAIKMAEGDILIFHDSDMIAPRDFVRRHLKHHKEKNIVVCGIPWKRINTFYYNELENKEKDYEGLKYIKNAHNKIEKAPILNENLIINGMYKNYIFDLNGEFIDEVKGIIKKYGNNLIDYSIPWRLFITNNASVEHEKVINVGMFDEQIVGYGFEDYDLGIRLYKSGGKFIFDENIINVHQEHPSNIKSNEFNENIRYICEKYNNIHFIDVILVCMMYLTSIDKSSINELVQDIDKMLASGAFDYILNLFLVLLQLQRKKSINEDLGESLFYIRSINLIDLFKEIDMLENIFEIKYFARAMAALINDVFKQG